jgi:hypothetical protein
MGDLATHLGVFHQTGTARDEYSCLSSMDIGKAEFFTVFGRTVNDLILRHRVDLDRKSWRRAAKLEFLFVYRQFPHRENRRRCQLARSGCANSVHRFELVRVLVRFNPVGRLLRNANQM